MPRTWPSREEDVLSYALFPQVAEKFFERRKEAREGGNVPEISVKVIG